MLKHPRKTQGFSLIELIVVMLILGILATSVSQFLRYGASSYTDSADREDIIANARFVIERLNRELRNAVPNSIRITSDATMQCLEYVPIAESVNYLDIPVAPEPASNTIEFLMMRNALPSNVNYLSVYALTANDIYARRSGVVEQINRVNYAGSANSVSSVQLANNVVFQAESPTKRLYFLSPPIAYCMQAGNIYRYEGYAYSGANTPINNGSNRVLMAEYLTNNFSVSTELPFKHLPATLQRNAIALVRLKFTRNLEDIVFNNEIQVPNVP